MFPAGNIGVFSFMQGVENNPDEDDPFAEAVRENLKKQN